MGVAAHLRPTADRAGIPPAGPASKALKGSSRFRGRRAGRRRSRSPSATAPTATAAPLVPVVTLPDGRTVGTLGVQTDLQRVDAPERGADRRADRLLTPRPVARGWSRRTAVRRSRSFTPSWIGLELRREPQSRRGGALGHCRRKGGGRACPPDGLRRGGQDGGNGSGPGVLLEAVIGGLGALVVLAFVFASFPGPRAAGDALVHERRSTWTSVASS